MKWALLNSIGGTKAVPSREVMFQIILFKEMIRFYILEHFFHRTWGNEAESEEWPNRWLGFYKHTFSRNLGRKLKNILPLPYRQICPWWNTHQYEISPKEIISRHHWFNEAIFNYHECRLTASAGYKWRVCCDLNFLIQFNS